MDFSLDSAPLWRRGLSMRLKYRDLFELVEALRGEGDGGRDLPLDGLRPHLLQPRLLNERIELNEAEDFAAQDWDGDEYRDGDESCDDYLDEEGRYPLHVFLANTHGDRPDVLIELLDNGAKMESTDDCKRTALMWAASRGFEQSVSMLLERGAQRDLHDKDGRTAADLARLEGHENLADHIDSFVSKVELEHQVEESKVELERRRQEEQGLDEEEKQCLNQLKGVFNREGIAFTSRGQLQAMYLGQYEEVKQYFGVGRKFQSKVSTDDMIEWLRDEASGKKFWERYCVECGLPVKPYNAKEYQIEHICNQSWGGVDHPLNYMVLWRALNNAPEFRYGPSHIKMITIGKATFECVQCFARWWLSCSKKRPYDFIKSKDAQGKMLCKIQFRSLFNSQSLLSFKPVTSGAGPSGTGPSGAEDQPASSQVASKKSRKRPLNQQS